MRDGVAWVVRGLAVASSVLAFASGACGAGTVRSDPPTRESGRACARPAECRLVWTTDDVCGCCGTPRRGHAEALSGRAAAERMGVGCPACDCPADPTLLATCSAGACQVVDLETSALTACATDTECIATPGTCGPATALVPLRRGEEAHLAASLGCTPAPPAIAHGARARCEAGHCRLAPTAVGPPVPIEGPAGSALPASGAIGTCEVRLGTAEAWRSWQMVVGVDGSPDDFSRVLLRVSLDARCTSRAVVSADGWLESGAERFPLRYEIRQARSHTVAPGVIEPGRDVALEVVAIDAPFVTAPVVRAVLRVRLEGGGELLLSTPELSVGRVS